MEFFAKSLAGSAAIGAATEGDDMIQLLMDAQGYIDRILNIPAHLDKTGEDLDLLGTPGAICSPEQVVMLNSSVLTPRDLQAVEGVRAHGPADVAILFMPHPTKDDGFNSLHFELVVMPTCAEDGMALAYSVTLAYTEEWDPVERRYVLDEYKVGSLGVGPLNSLYGRMLSSPEGKIANSPPNLILPVRQNLWHLSMAESYGHQKARHVKPVPGQDYGRIPFPARGAAIWPCISTEQHSRLLRVEALGKIALERGEAISSGVLTPFNSCGAFISALLATMLPDDVLSHVEGHTTELDQLALKLVTIAPKCLWAKEGIEPRIYDILPERRMQVYEEIKSEEAVKRMRRIFEDPGMLNKSTERFPSWADRFMNFRRPHPDMKARFLYKRASRVMVDELRRRAGSGERQYDMPREQVIAA